MSPQQSRNISLRLPPSLHVLTWLVLHADQRHVNPIPVLARLPDILPDNLRPGKANIKICSNFSQLNIVLSKSSRNHKEKTAFYLWVTRASGVTASGNQEKNRHFSKHCIQLVLLQSQGRSIRNDFYSS